MRGREDVREPVEELVQAALLCGLPRPALGATRAAVVVDVDDVEGSGAAAGEQAAELRLRVAVAGRHHGAGGHAQFRRRLLQDGIGALQQRGVVVQPLLRSVGD